MYVCNESTADEINDTDDTTDAATDTLYVGVELVTGGCCLAVEYQSDRSKRSAWSSGSGSAGIAGTAAIFFRRHGDFATTDDGVAVVVNGDFFLLLVPLAPSLVVI